ncbi:hypothetical protein [Catenulispora subtropica]
MHEHHDHTRPEPEWREISTHVPGLHWDPGRIPAWLRQTSGEPRWPVTLGVLLAIALQLALPDRYALRPRYLLPVAEVLLLAGLIAANPVRFQREHPAIRWASIGLTLLVGGANFGSIARLVNQILHHQTVNSPTDYAQTLLGSGIAIWITNVLAFALVYWQFDRGGPFSRAQARKPYPDFLFPQMTDPSKAHEDWEPGFVDYAYLSFTNSTAFSPTDTLPMSSWAKLMMMTQSAVSLITVALVAARAVNVLP